MENQREQRPVPVGNDVGATSPVEGEIGQLNSTASTNLTLERDEMPEEEKENHPSGWTLGGGNDDGLFAVQRERSNSYPFRGMTQTALVDDKNAGAQRRLTTAFSSTQRMQAMRKEALKLSSTQIQELTSSPESLPVRALSAAVDDGTENAGNQVDNSISNGDALRDQSHDSHIPHMSSVGIEEEALDNDPSSLNPGGPRPEEARPRQKSKAIPHRLQASSRNFSFPYAKAKQASGSDNPRDKPGDSVSEQPRHQSLPLANNPSEAPNDLEPSLLHDAPPSPSSSSIPLPPFSMPTYLHLELSSSARPSPLYIHRSTSNDFPFESSKLKFERLVNFLLLPPQLERLLIFGALACLDAWLYTFTILPLRFLKALWIFIDWLFHNLLLEFKDLTAFVIESVKTKYSPRRRHASSEASVASGDQDRRIANRSAQAISSLEDTKHQPKAAAGRGQKKTGRPWNHRRTKSTPSSLRPSHKADILQGLLIISSCMVLMRFDASRMYHGIRGQAAIKLYVIYNVLEVCDRLFSALGQDILECLFSSETLERKPDGRSKIGRPFWMFVLALVYTVIHATALFYQVVTLNVAVNSYSNALLTLLMSNQFVEIKGTVFKKFEKESLFQLTCADVVERFQLWFMLLIIALRNIVELGGLSVGTGDFAGPATSNPPAGNSTSNVPFRTLGILPKAFTLLPSLVPAHVLGPFLIVLGSEMLVDWLKHAYITKFNATSPKIYGRFYDVLAKDYYSNAFSDQNLTRRLGLPVIPLACLFIRATLQTYHMFLATNVFPPLTSTVTGIALEANATTTASPALAQIDHIFRTALGRSSFGGGNPSSSSIWNWSFDDLIALATMLVFFLALFLVLLAFKLVLGMVLLSVARERYKGMKEREEKESFTTGGKRIGGWGVVEVDNEKRKWIYEEDPEGLQAAKDRDAKARDRDAKEAGGKGFDNVERYRMVGKRIW